MLKTMRTHKDISHPNFKNGEEQAIYKVIDRDTGKTLKIDYRVRPTRYQLETHKEHLNINGKKITAEYLVKRFPYKDDYRVMLDRAYSVQYNPKTGIYTLNFYEEMKDGNLVPTNQFFQVDKQSKYGLSYTVNQNGQKENYIFGKSSGSFTRDVEEMQRLIKEMGLKFDI